ncbi:MAG: DinB family protein [Planctomycetaceae bacterium]
MSLLNCIKEIWEFNRSRTLATLDDIAKQADPIAVLGWRPGPGRAHIAWQLMHVAVTEELFATERLFGRPAAFADLIPRFKGGSTPDDNIPSVDQIREVLNVSRQHLLEGLTCLTESDLSRIPDSGILKERGWTFAKALQIINWHEAHHQGQAHITLNLWKNRT